MSGHGEGHGGGHKEGGHHGGGEISRRDFVNMLLMVPGMLKGIFDSKEFGSFAEKLGGMLARFMIAPFERKGGGGGKAKGGHGHH